MDEDTLYILHSYFKEFPKWLAKHQLDSYNDFINNQIPLILKTKNKHSVYLYDKEYNNNKLSYQINIYFAGKNGDRYTLSLPSIYDHDKGKMRPLYPNEARLKNLTYGIDFFYDLELEYIIKEEDTVIFQEMISSKIDTSFLENLYLGKIPIMLQSDMCYLSSIPMDGLKQFGESRYEPGGYFIIDGREKVMLGLERKAENIIFLSNITEATAMLKYSKTAEIKCRSNDAFGFARTNKLQLEVSGCITLRIGQQKAFIQEVTLPEYGRRDVPIFILFRFLGIETDEEIIKLIIGNIGNIGNNELNEKLANLLIASINDPYITHFNVYSRQDAENYLEPLVSRSNINFTGDKLKEIKKGKENRLSWLYQTIDSDLFPHISNNHLHKAYYLAYVVRKLLLFELDIEQETLRDNFANKRIDTSGFLLASLFHTALERGILYNSGMEIRRNYESNYTEFSNENIINIINENNIKKIFNFDMFNSKFMGMLKKGSAGENKIGAVQALDRINTYSIISHIRRINDPVLGGRVQDDQRKLNVSQYGYMCPAETPEGQNVGLRKALAILTNITVGYPINQLREFCYSQGVKELDSLSINDIHYFAKVFINGSWIGCSYNPFNLVNEFKLRRRNGLINSMTSISWYPEKNEIFIYCDNGRITRPLYIIENNALLLTDVDLKNIKDEKRQFTDLCFSRLARQDKESNDLTNTLIYSTDIIGLSETDKEGLNAKLHENQAVIEYIDIHEMDTLLISQSLDISMTDNHKYTHADIHPITMLGSMVQLSPLINHGQGGKYYGHSKHIKQAISLPADNFQHRIDTTGYVLHNPERPIIQTRMTELMNHHKLGTGNNIVVAVAYYNGYNQEDAMLVNKTSVEMGLFGSSKYKMFESFEKRDPKIGSEERFYNPLYTSEVESYPDDIKVGNEDSYKKLDKFGFIKEGSKLYTDDVLIGKYMLLKDESGQSVYSDRSVRLSPENIDIGYHGYVDKVFTCKTNRSGDRLCKIRTCKMKTPEMGDKFASRCGQKGTIALMIPREDMPYTEDGVVPDFVIHPSAFPKRMTLQQLLEMLYGRLAVDQGFLGMGNSLEKFDIKEIGDVLIDKLGMTYYGDEVLYNGVYGEQMDVKIFMGPIYYQRLKLMVADKINARSSGRRTADGVPIPGGAYTAKDRQVVSGRAQGGGIKIGEMERDCLIAHGVSGFLNERDMVRGDKFLIYVSRSNGEICIGNPDKGVYFDSLQDGPMSYHITDNISGNKTDILGTNTYGKQQMEFVKLSVPYATVLLIRELNGLGMFMRLSPEVVQMIIDKHNMNIDNLVSNLEETITQDEKEISELIEKSLLEQLESSIDSSDMLQQKLDTLNTKMEKEATIKQYNMSQEQPEVNNDKQQSLKSIFTNTGEMKHPSDVRNVDIDISIPRTEQANIYQPENPYLVGGGQQSANELMSQSQEFGIIQNPSANSVSFMDGENNQQTPLTQSNNDIISIKQNDYPQLKESVINMHGGVNISGLNNERLDTSSQLLEEEEIDYESMGGDADFSMMNMQQGSAQANTSNILQNPSLDPNIKSVSIEGARQQDLDLMGVSNTL
jgi:DNA-directed RNA polymerase II subunit RPB2